MNLLLKRGIASASGRLATKDVHISDEDDGTLCGCGAVMLAKLADATDGDVSEVNCPKCLEQFNQRQEGSSQHGMVVGTPEQKWRHRRFGTTGWNGHERNVILHKGESFDLSSIVDDVSGEVTYLIEPVHPVLDKVEVWDSYPQALERFVRVNFLVTEAKRMHLSKADSQLILNGVELEYFERIPETRLDEDGWPEKSS